MSANAKRSLHILAVLLVAIGPSPLVGGSNHVLAQSQSTLAPTVRPAVDGILAAFAAHPLVGMGDAHGLAQELDFYATMVRDPRFASEVGNVVVEFGGAAGQQTLDRYLNGETVPYAELRKVWSEVVGWVPTVYHLGYMNFFAHVRAVNAALPPEKRIRVWLGGSAVDWSKLNKGADLGPFFLRRDQDPADVIKREILAKNKKALVIYGHNHFNSPLMPPTGAAPPQSPFLNLKELIEKDHPNAFFIVTPYVGFNEKSCSADFEQTIQDWPNPAIATPVRTSTLANVLIRSGCANTSPLGPTPKLTEQQRTEMQRSFDEIVSGVAGDALLYLGPSTTLTRSPTLPDIYLDADYREEIKRRQFGRALSDEIPAAAPRAFRP